MIGQASKRSAILSLFFACLPLAAGTIDVTPDSQVTLQAGDSLEFQAGSANYAFNAQRYGLSSPYPGQMAILLAGLPASGPVAPIPGTSMVYTTGILFSGTLESVDGSVVIPLSDPNAARLGLPAGDMVLEPSYRSGGSYTGPTSVLTASVTVSSAEAAALFGSGEFLLRFRDVDGGMTFGFAGSPIASALSVSLISTDGSFSVGALPQQATLQHTPEPGTLALLLMALPAAWLLARRR
jgi:hypothetical protein